ncbi:MAG: hypothetical protein IPJ30_08735 [Acidobacteria bacterium]|nr:hypothetical protein [Acidobacteriota bacterium]
MRIRTRSLRLAATRLAVGRNPHCKGAQMIDAWNAIGLDYSVLGNHEFDIKRPISWRA